MKKPYTKPTLTPLRADDEYAQAFRVAAVLERETKSLWGMGPDFAPLWTPPSPEADRVHAESRQHLDRMLAGVNETALAIVRRTKQGGTMTKEALNIEFLRASLEDAREGADVTIESNLSPIVVRKALAEIGATEADLDCITIVSPSPTGTGPS
jgi:hypothetical protein